MNAQTLTDWFVWQRRCLRLRDRGLSRSTMDCLLMVHGVKDAEEMLQAIEALSDDQLRRMSRLGDTQRRPVTGFDAVTVVPRNAAIWWDPPPPVYCLDCDKPMEPLEQWQVVVAGGRVVRPLCRQCAVRRDPGLAS